jgi:hypothetical protein
MPKKRPLESDENSRDKRKKARYHTQFTTIAEVYGELIAKSMILYEVLAKHPRLDSAEPRYSCILNGHCKLFCALTCLPIQSSPKAIAVPFRELKDAIRCVSSIVTGCEKRKQAYNNVVRLMNKLSALLSDSVVKK